MTSIRKQSLPLRDGGRVRAAAREATGRLIVAAAVLLASCAGGPDGGLPAVPEVSAEAFPARVRQTATSRIQAVAEKPADPWANGDLGAILHAHGQVEAAQALYGRAEALSNGEFRWTYLLGVARQESGKSEAAADAFRRALGKRKYGPAYIRLGETLAAQRRWEEAEGALRSALALGGNEAAANYALGRTMLDRGEAAEAVALLERSVSLSPESGAARYALGMARRAAGDTAAAQEVLESASGLDDRKPAFDDPVLARVRALAADEHYFLNLGKSLEAAGQVADAIAAYENALSLHPGMATAHANLVGAYGRSGDFANAEDHYTAALSIDRNIEELHNNWGVLQAARRDPAAAAASFRRALEINPQSAKAHANLGVALIELEDRQQAAQHFVEAVASDPSNRPARTNLGAMALEEGRPAAAISHFEAALGGATDGSEPFIRYSLGRAYRGVGRDAEARQSFEQALRLAAASGQDDLSARIRMELDADAASP